MPKATLKDQFDFLMTKAGTALKDFISSLVQGLQYNSNLIDPQYSALLTQALYNGQKMVLQNALNTYFGLAANSIIVTTNSSLIVHKYFYNKSENNPQFIYNNVEGKPFYVWNGSETVSAYHYTISIPVGIATTEFQSRVRAITNQWALAGRIFNIITY